MHTVIDHNAAYSLCILWFALLAVLFVDARTKASSGLTLIYAAQLSILHLPGGMLLLVPWYEYYPRIWTFLGFQMTCFGLAAFVGGALAARFLLPISAASPKQPSPLAAKRLGVLLIATGLVFTLLISQLNFLFQIPSLAAILSAIWLLGAPGLCIYMHAFILNGEKMPLHVYVIALGFPALSMIMLGFLGFGVTYIIFIVCFGISQKYFPKLIFALAPALIYVGISFFVNYLEQRNDIRDAVWGEQVLSARTDAVSVIFTEFEWFDSDNFFHLKSVDERLNQNWLVGASIESLDFGRTQFLYGESLVFALVAWVPRIIWVNKPVVAGSGDIAAGLTGLNFAAGTSVGVGHILEFYGNFGIISLLIGMFLIGFILRALDLKSSAYLAQNNLVMWLRWVIPGIAITNVGGQLAETVAGVAAFIIVGYLLQFGVTRLSRRFE